MGSNSNSPTSDPDEAKGAFRKPSNDAGNRKYRRRSSASPSASPDESPKQDLHSNPALLKEDKRRKHSTRDDRVSIRGEHEHDNDSRRYSSKGSQGYIRSSDHARGGKDVDVEDKSSSRLSSRSGRESRGGDYNRSRDSYHHKDKYKERSDTTERASRDKYGDRDRRGRDRDYRDERKDYGRSSRDYKSDHITSREESRRNQDDMILRREADKNDNKAELRSKHSNEENKRCEEDGRKESRGKFQDDAPANRNEENAVKRPKLSGFDSNDPTRGSDQGSHLVKDTPGQAAVNMPGSAGNVDAAKVAAMKAAELVNKNLGSTGVMTADQKKKLLWGNKKNTSTEESSSHRWDSAIFPDRERQEKFNKLMGVKGEVKLAQDPSSGDPVLTDKQRELQMDLEKQYTAGLRRRDGRTVGLGL